MDLKRNPISHKYFPTRKAREFRPGKRIILYVQVCIYRIICMEQMYYSKFERSDIVINDRFIVNTSSCTFTLNPFECDNPLQIFNTYNYLVRIFKFILIRIEN